MFIFNQQKQERKVCILVKSEEELTSCTTSRASLTPYSSENLVGPHQHKFQVKLLEGPPQPFTIRINIGNLPQPQKCHRPACSPQNQELKSVNLKQIAESVIQLKRALLLYRYLERDEEKRKKIVFSWFKEAEAAFLHCLNGPFSPAPAQALLQEELKARSRKILPNAQENLHLPFTSSSKSLASREVEQLRWEVEVYRRDSIEALQKVEVIMKMAAGLKSRLEAVRKEREIDRCERECLAAILRGYVQQADQVVEKIAAKQKVEGKVTPIQRRTIQVLTKFKFKAYAASTI